MEHRELGRSGLAVPPVALGCGNFGGVGSAPEFFGAGETEPQAFALMDAAWAEGITFFDTADAYGGGRSERWIGNWLRERGHERDELVLGTKVFHSVEGDPADRGLAPARIARQIEGSLARLGVERVDLYLIHEPDPDTPLDDTLGALDELVRRGTVRAIGASNVDAAWLERALAISAERGLARIECVQNPYSLLEPAAAEDVLSACERHGVAFTAFSPLAGGWLTGKYRRGEAPPPGSRMTLRPEPYRHLVGERTYRVLDAFAEAASVRGTDVATLALAWVASDPRVTSVVVGPRRPEQLEPAVAALELRLTAAERDELARLFA